MSANLTTKTVKIAGMTCVSCENRIKRELIHAQGISAVKISYATGYAEITFDPEVISMQEIQQVVEDLDYTVVKTKAGSSLTGGNLVGLGLIILALYMFSRHFGLLNLFNYFPQAKEGMGYGMLFVIGLLTSVHCISMCGGINLAQCMPQIPGAGDNKLSALRPSILYNLGRVISYTVIGGIVGGIGSVVSFSGYATGLVQLAAGVFMIIMGLNMLNLFPWLRRFNPRMPHFFARKINEHKKSNSSLFVGLLNGLMPCGPLQAMQLYALSTGDPWKGAVSMFLFSIGTVPLMFGLGALSTFINKKFSGKMVTASAVLVLVLGFSMFSSGMSLSGIAFPLSNSAGKDGSSAVIKDGIQIVTSQVYPGGYEPITVQKGIPVRWIIQAEPGAINGCNNAIIIPKYDKEKTLEPGDNIIEFTPTESGVVRFSCWMGMIRSTITVVDDIDAGE